MPELDGLRGWASLSVVVFHLTHETFGVLFPIYRSEVSSLIGHGRLAVGVFFLISGYVLTVRRWHSPNGNLPLTLVRRYLRLEVPILAASLIYCALIVLHLTPSAEAGRIVHREDWLSIFTAFDPSFVGAVCFAAMKTYWILYDENYGPFLWTMIVEFWGSMIVLSVSQTERLWREPYSLLFLVTVILLCFFPPAAPFTIGALIARAQRDGLLFRSEPGRVESAIALVAFVVGLVAGTYCEWVYSDQPPLAIASVVVFLGAFRSKPIVHFLRTPLSIWLGRISFPLYLIQASILVTLTSWLIIVFDGAGRLNQWTALLIGVVSLAAALAAAWAFMPVETFTLWLVRQMGRSRTKPIPAKA